MLRPTVGSRGHGQGRSLATVVGVAYQGIMQSPVFIKPLIEWPSQGNDRGRPQEGKEAPRH